MSDYILFIAGLAIGGLISWSITHRYYKKASAEQERLLAQFSEDLSDRNTVRYFLHLLDTSSWEKEVIDSTERWISQNNNIYQIERGARMGDFSEPWTESYPDSSAGKYPVYLKIGDTTIKKLTFISADGGRIFVPLPERQTEDGNLKYFWKLDSLELKVCKIIGKYYVYKSLAKVAIRSDVAIVP